MVVGEWRDWTSRGEKSMDKTDVQGKENTVEAHGMIGVGDSV